MGGWVVGGGGWLRQPPPPPGGGGCAVLGDAPGRRQSERVAAAAPMGTGPWHGPALTHHRFLTHVTGKDGESLAKRPPSGWY